MEDFETINLSILAKCLLSLNNVKVVVFNRQYTNDGNGYFQSIVFNCDDLAGKHLDGYTCNGNIEVKDYDYLDEELHDSFLLHQVAKLALLQGFITKERFERRYSGKFTNAKMYNQVSQELFAEVLKTIYDKECGNARVDKQYTPLDQLFGYHLDDNVCVSVYESNKKLNPLKSNYSEQKITEICNTQPIDLDNYDEENSEISKLVAEHMEEKYGLVRESINTLKSYTKEVIQKFDRKYGYQLDEYTKR